VEGGRTVTRRETIARYVPARLATLALLLVVLIVLTPVLLSNGQPVAGSILAQAELIVDHVSGSNVTNFYLRGLGTTTRYSQMSIDVATDFNWTGAFPTGSLAWRTGASGSDLLAVFLNASANPIALNVSALYQTPGGSALYIGEIAFELGAPAGPTATNLYAASPTPGLAVSSSNPVSTLPLIIQLVDVGSGP
jgi:hypothetical protein